MKLVIYSLRSVNDKSKINYDLTALLTNYFDHHDNILEIKLDTGTIYLPKWQYVNKGKIYQDPKNPKCFFMIFGYKKANEDYVFNKLMQYAIDKLNESIESYEVKRDNLFKIKTRLQKEIAA